jgi:hypothetical protein
LVALVLLAACTSNRPALAIKATVETFYAGIANENVSFIDDNLAPSASPAFRDHVLAAASAAQQSAATQRAVQTVRIGQPVIKDSMARVHVVFADGSADNVSLVRQGVRWKVVTSGRLG